MPWTALPPVSQSWTTVTKSAATWRGSGPPSTESRLNRVFPLTETSVGDIDFVWQVRSEGQFFVASGNGVQVKSRITDGP